MDSTPYVVSITSDVTMDNSLVERMPDNTYEIICSPEIIPYILTIRKLLRLEDTISFSTVLGDKFTEDELSSIID